MKVIILYLPGGNSDPFMTRTPQDSLHFLTCEECSLQLKVQQLSTNSYSLYLTQLYTPASLHNIVLFILPHVSDS